MKQFTWLLGLLFVLSGLAGCAASKKPAADQRYATLVDIGSPQASMYSVTITGIDGRRLVKGQAGHSSHRVSPGLHTVHAEAKLGDSSIDRRRKQYPPLPLVMAFESGTRYYLAATPTENNIGRLQIVVWKTKETASGLLKVQ